jgi:hypothetical protein
VLVREPVYRRALAEISTPLDAVGEPLEQFLVLPNPKPGAAAPDTGLTFASPPKVTPQPDITWVGTFVANADAQPVMIAGGKAGLYIDGLAVTALGPMAVATGADAVLDADLNYDFRTDLVVASPTGVAFLRQGGDGRFTNVTRETGLPATITKAPAYAVWAADADTDGDLDVVLAPLSGAPMLLRNNGDGTFVAQTPFAGVSNVRNFVWADLDGEGVPDAAFLDEHRTSAAVRSAASRCPAGDAPWLPSS